MSMYTTQVRWICETNSGFDPEKLNAGQYSVNEILDASHSKIFNFDYPIYQASHRAVLEKKILKHYYTREIAAETVELWRLWLDDTLNRIMPKYNELYRLADYNVSRLFDNVDFWSKIDRQHDYRDVTDDTTNLTHGHTVDTNTGTDITVDTYYNDRVAHSDTPQGGLVDVDSMSYMSDYTHTWSDGDNTRTTGDFNKNRERSINSGTDKTKFDGTKTGSGTDDDLIHDYGYRGGKTYAEMLYDFSEQVLNIDQMIIDELRDLFFYMW